MCASLTGRPGACRFPPRLEEGMAFEFPSDKQPESLQEHQVLLQPLSHLSSFQGLEQCFISLFLNFLYKSYKCSHVHKQHGFITLMMNKHYSVPGYWLGAFQQETWEFGVVFGCAVSWGQPRWTTLDAASTLPTLSPPQNQFTFLFHFFLNLLY